MAELDYYKILGVPRTASAAEIKRRYQFLSKKYHPDHGGDDNIMSLINEAYRVLSSPTNRATQERAHASNGKYSRGSESKSEQPVRPQEEFAKQVIHNKHLVAGVLIACVVLAIAATGIYAYEQDMAATKRAQVASFKENANQIGAMANQFLNIYQQWSSLPSTTTKLQADWDSYYSGLITQAQGIQTASSTKTYGDDTLDSFNKSVQTACTDFINQVTLDKSDSDMGFQIQADQNKMDADQSTLATEQGINNTGISEGLPSDLTYVNEFSSRVATDRKQLSTDQQTLKSQQDQSGTLNLTLLGDAGGIRLAGGKAGFKFAY